MPSSSFALWEGVFVLWRGKRSMMWGLDSQHLKCQELHIHNSTVPIFQSSPFTKAMSVTISSTSVESSECTIFFKSIVSYWSRVTLKDYLSSAEKYTRLTGRLVVRFVLWWWCVFSCLFAPVLHILLHKALLVPLIIKNSARVILCSQTKDRFLPLLNRTEYCLKSKIRESDDIPNLGEESFAETMFTQNGSD